MNPNLLAVYVTIPRQCFARVVYIREHENDRPQCVICHKWNNSDVEQRVLLSGSRAPYMTVATSFHSVFILFLFWFVRNQ